MNTDTPARPSSCHAIGAAAPLTQKENRLAAEGLDELAQLRAGELSSRAVSWRRTNVGGGRGPEEFPDPVARPDRVQAHGDRIARCGGGEDWAAGGRSMLN